MQLQSPVCTLRRGMLQCLSHRFIFVTVLSSTDWFPYAKRGPLLQYR
jgi:hypothetical protein